MAVTDHLSLKWLLSLKGPREKLARWVVDIKYFDFTIAHRSGPELVVPDALSRDAVPMPLCQRYHCLLDGFRLEEISEKADAE